MRHNSYCLFSVGALSLALKPDFADELCDSKQSFVYKKNPSNVHRFFGSRLAFVLEYLSVALRADTAKICHEQKRAEFTIHSRQ